MVLLVEYIVLALQLLLQPDVLALGTLKYILQQHKYPCQCRLVLATLQLPATMASTTHGTRADSAVHHTTASTCHDSVPQHKVLVLTGLQTKLQNTTECIRLVNSVSGNTGTVCGQHWV